MNSFGDVPLPSHVARVYLHALPCEYTWMYSWTLTCEHLGCFLCGVSLGSTGANLVACDFGAYVNACVWFCLGFTSGCRGWTRFVDTARTLRQSFGFILNQPMRTTDAALLLGCCAEFLVYCSPFGVVFIVSLFSLPGLFAVICHWLRLNVSVSTDVDFLHLPLDHWLLFGRGL